MTSPKTVPVLIARCRHRGLFWLFCLIAIAIAIAIATPSNAGAEPVTEITPTENMAGAWTIDFGAKGEKEKTVESSTPNVRGYRFEKWLAPHDLLLLRENFEDGARYVVYRDGGGKPAKLYELDGMLGLWKASPLEQGHGGYLLFIGDSSDYESIENAVRDPKIFTIVAVDGKHPSPEKFSCGFRVPGRILASYAARPNGVSDGEFLLNSVGSRSMLICSKS